MCQWDDDNVQTPGRPQNYKELFNYRHIWLHSIIECIFGVVEQHFKVLVIAQEYSPEVQSHLICRLVLVHNFYLHL